MLLTVGKSLSSALVSACKECKEQILRDVIGGVCDVLTSNNLEFVSCRLKSIRKEMTISMSLHKGLRDINFQGREHTGVYMESQCILVLF